MTKPFTRRPRETIREFERRLRASGLSRSQARIEASRPAQPPAPEKRGLLWWLPLWTK